MSSTDSPDGDLRAARRSLMLFVVALAAGLVGLIVIANGWTDEDATDTRVGSGEIEAAGSIGPDVGVEVAPYVDERAGHLREVEGRRAAVISFTGYVSGEEAATLVGDDLQREALLVALPGDSVRISGSPSDARAEAVAEAESQLEEIGSIAPTVEDGEFASFYRAELIRYRKVLAEADRTDVVFGAVVVGRASDLRAAASRAGVRLVDVGESAEVPDPGAMSGLLPEESITTGEPAFRP